MNFTVEQQRLSDGSVAHNVVGRNGDEVITIGTTDKESAKRVAELLNDDSFIGWVQIGEVHCY